MLFYLLVVLKLSIALGDAKHLRVIRQDGSQSSPISTSSTSTIAENTDIDFSQCGVSNKKQDNIVSPKPNLKLGDWPWVVALGFRTTTNPTPRFLCGANLISNQWLVTAAHCANPRPHILTIARFGDLHLNNDGDNSTIVEIPIDGVILHPNYTTNNKKISDDIALIRLKNPVNFTNFIRPVCILDEPDHKTNEFYSEKWFYEVSWNRSKLLESATKSNTLQQISVKIEENEKCAQKYQNQPLSSINERVLCAGADNSNESCQLVSGGSLNIPIKNRYYLAGVSSYGLCNKSGYPNVFTRMAYYAEWIKRVANL